MTILTWLLKQQFGGYIAIAIVFAIFGAGVASGSYTTHLMAVADIANAKVETAQAKEARADDGANANAAGAQTNAKDGAHAVTADQHTNHTAEARRTGYDAAEQEANNAPPAPIPAKTICPPSIAAGPLRTLFAGLRNADAVAATASPDRGGAPAAP
jgi:hypothetical protein